MIETRSETESSPVATAIASTVKKLFLDCELILPIINEMMNLFTGTQKKKFVVFYIISFPEHFITMID